MLSFKCKSEMKISLGIQVLKINLKKTIFSKAVRGSSLARK